MNPSYLAGLGFALVTHIAWGALPLYWALLKPVDPLEVLAHRVVWTFPFAALTIHFSRQWPAVGAVLRQPQQLALLGLSAALIAINWGLYIWSVGNGRVVEASLGYYLTPLVSVLLGVLVFGERPRPLQWLAVGLAAAGVMTILLGEGVLPWVSLVLAVSFGSYGALRKRSRADATAGQLIETMWLLPLSLGWAGYLLASGRAAFTNSGPAIDLLMMGSGLATALPLLWYVAAARRLPLATLGILSYLNPTLQFLLGVLVFKEPLSSIRLYAFCLIWLGIAVYVGEGLLRQRR